MRKHSGMATRFLAIVFAVVLIFQSLSGSIVLAADTETKLPEDEILTETEAPAETEAQVEMEAQSENGPQSTDGETEAEPEETLPQVQEPTDWTNRSDQFLLQLSGITYQEKDAEPVHVFSEASVCDISEMHPDSLEQLQLEYAFEYFASEVGDELRTGDAFSFLVPETQFAIEDTDAPVALKAWDKNGYFAGEAADGQSVIGTYTISSNVVSVVFDETAVSQAADGLFGVIAITGKLNKEALNSQEVTAVPCETQTSAPSGPISVSVILPKSVEGNTEAAGETDREAADETEQPETEKPAQPAENSTPSTDDAQDKQQSEEETQENWENSTLNKNLSRLFGRALAVFGLNDAGYAGGNTYKLVFDPEELPETAGHL